VKVIVSAAALRAVPFALLYYPTTLVMWRKTKGEVCDLSVGKMKTKKPPCGGFLGLS
jgi:hypothetical protein